METASMKITVPGALLAMLIGGVSIGLLGPSLAQTTTSSTSSVSSSSIECPTGASAFAPGKSSNQPPGKAKQQGTAASSVAPGHLMQDCSSSSSSAAQ